jgi:UDP-3-O-[3-hydroxymyristoyl] glucosamine N-acyltransferase
MEFTALEVANMIKGEVQGDPNVKVNKLSKIEEGSAGSISFLANKQYEPFIYDTLASVVIVNNTFQPEKELKETCTLIKVEDAYISFATLLETYQKLKLNKQGIEAQSFIHPSSILGGNIFVGAFAYISSGTRIGNNSKIHQNVFIGEGVEIGDNVTLFPGVKVYDHCKIHNNVTIHSGTVIGSDGFGFAPDANGNYKKIPQIGNVIIEKNVEIGSNCTIDRATMGSTIIRQGVKLDNLIMIAHNVEIGENTVIAAQSGVAGSVKIGKNCMFGGQVGISGHIQIADGVKLAAQSGVGSSITEEGEVLQGSPAFSAGAYKRSYVYFKKLPSIIEKMEILIKKIKLF